MDDNDGRSPDPATSAGAAPQEARPGPEPTGDARVDEALSRLTELDDTPVGEHVAVVEDIHRALQDALAEDED